MNCRGRVHLNYSRPSRSICRRCGCRTDRKAAENPTAPQQGSPGGRAASVKAREHRDDTDRHEVKQFERRNVPATGSFDVKPYCSATDKRRAGIDLRTACRPL